MSTKALVGILLAGTAGIVIFLFVHMGASGNITVAPSKASACSKGAGDCLPDVKYVDTTGHTYTAEALAGWMFRTLVDAGLPVVRLRLWETPTSYAEVTP